MYMLSFFLDVNIELYRLHHGSVSKPLLSIEIRSVCPKELLYARGLKLDIDSVKVLKVNIDLWTGALESKRLKMN